MKALISGEAGGPDTLAIGSLPSPIAGPGQLVVQVKACGINFPDTLIIEDKYQVRPERPFAPGGEMSGEVVAVGEGVSGFDAGDRVLGTTSSGGLAEQIAIPAAACAKIPAAMPWDVAAALEFTYGTSIHALRDRAALKAGETLLVTGAAGGVGLAAVQLGKAMGARVVAAVSSEAKAETARAAGADDVVIYPTTLDRDSIKSLSAALKAACGKNGADVICDTVGGDYAEAALRAVAWNGRFLVIGFPAGIQKIPANLVLLKACSIVGVFWGAFVERELAKNLANTRELSALWEGGKIAPHISARYSLDEGGAAIAELAERRALGKAVVTLS